MIYNQPIRFNRFYQRSDLSDIEKWPEVLNDDFISIDRKMSRKKKFPLNIYRSRTLDFKEREKKNGLNNNSKLN
jgi:hypothetical protein